jgi:hypothetical protein
MSSTTRKPRPILCLDFDGVCHSYTSGWQGADIILEPPVPGMWEFLEDATAEFEVHILSSRSHQTGGRDAMLGWFLKWAATDKQKEIASLLLFSTEKPPALVTLDDRALTFTGTWPKVSDLLAFKPWYQTQAGTKSGV